jgi:hypothetical protein
MHLARNFWKTLDQSSLTSERPRICSLLALGDLREPSLNCGLCSSLHFEEVPGTRHPDIGAVKGDTYRQVRSCER